MPSKTKRYFGFKPSFPHVLAERPKFFVSFAKPSVIAPSCQLTMPFPAYDQLSLGSCVSNAVCAVVQYMGIKQNLFNWVPSRLFTYFNTREIEGTVTYDSGAYGSDGFAIVRDVGVCPETMWKYDISKFTDTPDTECYVTAQLHKGRILGLDVHLDDIKTAIFMGFPVAFGIPVFESIEWDKTAETGYIPYPSDSEGQIGGHEMVLFAYEEATKKFQGVRNSWGINWGNNGNGSIDYRYIEDFCSEAGTIEAMNG